jgi:hypothetical protein
MAENYKLLIEWLQKNMGSTIIAALLLATFGLDRIHPPSEEICDDYKYELKELEGRVNLAERNQERIIESYNHVRGSIDEIKAYQTDINITLKRVKTQVDALTAEQLFARELIKHKHIDFDHDTRK